MRRVHPLILRIGTPFHLKVFGLIFLAMALGVMPLADQEIKRISGGTGRLDCRFFYTPGEVYAHLEALGKAGRSMYALVEGTAGNIFPLIYGLFFLAGLSFFRQNSGRWLLLPVGIAAADWLENACFIGLIASFSFFPSALAWIALAMTILKWTGLACLLGLALKIALQKMF